MAKRRSLKQKAHFKYITQLAREKKRANKENKENGHTNTPPVLQPVDPLERARTSARAANIRAAEAEILLERERGKNQTLARENKKLRVDLEAATRPQERSQDAVVELEDMVATDDSHSALIAENDALALEAVRLRASVQQLSDDMRVLQGELDASRGGSMLSGWKVYAPGNGSPTLVE